MVRLLDLQGLTAAPTGQERVAQGKASPTSDALGVLSSGNISPEGAS